MIEPGERDEHGRPLAGRFTGLSLGTDDVQREYERLRSLGVRMSGLPERQPWGGMLLTVADPAGQEFQIAQYPKAG
jgi:uncharacterized glyoxalase superfamily protein PhnB